MFTIYCHVNSVLFSLQLLSYCSLNIYVVLINSVLVELQYTWRQEVKEMAALISGLLELFDPSKYSVTRYMQRFKLFVKANDIPEATTRMKFWQTFSRNRSKRLSGHSNLNYRNISTPSLRL